MTFGFLEEIWEESLVIPPLLFNNQTKNNSFYRVVFNYIEYNNLGWDGGIRTPECWDQNPVPYHLATSQ